MVRKCVVPSCTVGNKSNVKRLSLFKVPKHKLEEWNRLIPSAIRRLTEKDNICEKHFSSSSIIRELKTECYTIKLAKPRLSDDAEPTLFPGCSKYLSRSEELGQTLKRNESSIALSEGKKLKLLQPVEGVLLIDADNVEIEELEEIQKIEEIEEIENIVKIEETLIKIEEFKIYPELLKAHKMLRLPSDSWAIFNIHDEVWISELRTIKGSDLILKNVKISNTSVIFKVFGKQLSCFYDRTFNSVADFEDTLEEFNDVSVCLGSLRDLPSSIKSKTMVFQENLSSWRHVKCTLIVELPNKKSCSLCTKGGSMLDRLRRKGIIAEINKQKKINRNKKAMSRLKIGTQVLLARIQMLEDKVERLENEIKKDKKKES